MCCHGVVVLLFSQGLGCFSGFLVSMLVAYLLMKRKIVKMMSGYQVLRSTLQFLGEFPGTSLDKERLLSLHKASAQWGKRQRGLCGFSFVLCPCGWDGQEGMSQQRWAGWCGLQWVIPNIVL